MESHQERVIAEKQELDSKIEKLQSFLKSPKFDELVPDAEDAYLLVKQKFTMIEYSNILQSRINRFN